MQQVCGQAAIFSAKNPIKIKNYKRFAGLHDVFYPKIKIKMHHIAFMISSKKKEIYMAEKCRGKYCLCDCKSYSFGSVIRLKHLLAVG
jgi:hypothetical protein